MHNKIDTAIPVVERRRILDLLPFQIDLTPEERQSLVKMGDWGKPPVDPN